ncbi:Amino-transferase class IV [Candidatus Gugararchaeum adminiculabundum]|nr:Amino-transferase class IV [Candidatus Gugararchaeum adminiculabundum]
MAPVNPTKFIWMNGKLVKWEDAKIHVLTHALHYGSGVFEGIRCYKTPKGPAVFRLKDHIQRLVKSAEAYKMKLPYSAEEMCKAVKDTVRENKIDACYIRPILYNGYGEMGLNPTNCKVDFAVAVWEWGTYLGEEGLEKGVRVKVSSWSRFDQRSMPTAAKACGNYLNSILAKLEAIECGVDECILLNTNGSVAEGPGENVFAVYHGKLLTPPGSAGILYGITRNSIMHVARDMGMEVIERDMNRNDLYLADELFFTGTAAEVSPIREVDGRKIGIGKRGPVTEKLQKKFFEIAAGKDLKYEKWLDYVK